MCEVYTTKAGTQKDVLVPEDRLMVGKPGLGVQNLAFEYKQHQTNPLQTSVSVSCQINPTSSAQPSGLGRPPPCPHSSVPQSTLLAWLFTCVS